MRFVRPDRLGVVFNTNDLPGLSKALVEALEAQYPPRCQGLTETERAHHQYAGMVALIQRMRTELDERGEDTGVDIERIIKEDD